MKTVRVLIDKEFEKHPVNKASLAQRKVVCGVGVNDSDYLTKYRSGDTTYVCAIYDRWKNMLQRCKSGKGHYSECSVNPKWYSFMNFRNWIIENTGDLTDLELDKDLLVFGNTEYGPDRCLLIHSSTNILISSSHKTSSLIGTHWSKRDKRFVVRIDGRHIGNFKSELEAHNAWYSEKRRIILDHCDTLKDTKIISALHRRYPINSPYITR